MGVEKSGGLYIHAAYCRMKCIYCDFYSVGARIADWTAYVDALISELNHRIAELPSPLKTVYIGGGTPSLMPGEDFMRLCRALSQYMQEVEEFTIEVNPDDVTPEMLQIWKSGGVNRLSIGIQSFDDNLLKAIKRRHTYEKAKSSFEMAKQVFGNVSIDLIFGIPGQTVEMWRRDIQQAIEMHPTHISSYSLMYEEGTALTFLRDRGIVAETPEETSEEMMKILLAELKNAGYEHYEISNFALPGFRSLHNSSYWQGIAYLGLGPSAHSYDGHGCRSANKADVGEYIRYWKDSGVGTEPIGEEETGIYLSTHTGMIQREYLSDEELREEYIMIGLRTKEGINLNEFIQRFGEAEYIRLLKRSENYINEGSLILAENHLSLSEQSILISDTIILALA